MNKTGSVVAATLLAVSLASCSSSTDKTAVGATSAESMPAESSAEASSDLPQAEVPTKCQKLYPLLQVGDVIDGQLLHMCIRASLANVNSAQIEFVQEGDYPTITTTGSVVRDGENLNIDVANQGTKIRRIGDQYWLDIGNGWQESSADYLEIQTLLAGTGIDDLFNGVARDQEIDSVEYTVAEVSDEGWLFELPIANYVSSYLVNKSYYVDTKAVKDTAGAFGTTLRISGLNKPVSIEAPI